MSSSRSGRLFIVSAPSGTGKTTLIDRLVQSVSGLRISRSYTSRPARPGETDGVDYNFVSETRFKEMVAAGAFLEHASVFGQYYGTGRADTDACLTAGDDLVLVIDVQGARQVRAHGRDTVSIFIMPPSSAALAERLQGRSKDSEAQIRTRLQVSSQEVDEYRRYDYVVINDEVDTALESLRAIVLAERCRLAQMTAAAEAIRATFARTLVAMALIGLGVTGGIGAYKAVEVCRGLQQRGHDVVAIMTRSATRFVGRVTFEAITRRPVLSSQWAPGANADIEHIAAADAIALLIVAPCTANVIGKFAHGIADDLLTSMYLATKAPVLLAPAMNSNMLAHPAVQQNLQTLAERGVHVVEPGEGYLACGWIGKGRLAEPDAIVDAGLRVLASTGSDSPLRGLRVVVTAGPTYEDIDAVRYLGNRSSGRMGFALAAAAERRGAVVTLIAGPTRLDPPRVAGVARVRSAREMHEAVMAHADQADVVIMAAAVADYTLQAPLTSKIAKTDGPLTLTLARTRDILAELGAMPSRSLSGRPILVGFAAETGDATEKARAKRARKGIDLIVANDVSEAGAGFDTDTNAVTILGEGPDERVALQSKDGVADAILRRVEALVSSGPRVPVRV